MTTITARELAEEVGLKVRAILNAIGRKTIRATRASRYRGAGDYTTTPYQITRVEADEWKAKRVARKVTAQKVKLKKAARKEPKRAQDNGFFENKDSYDLWSHSPMWQRDALAGDGGAKDKLRQIGMVKWWNREAGTII